jgi:hypothetical protein
MNNSNGWNPEDGPEPTEEEILAAQTLASSLEQPPNTSLTDATEMALRVRAIHHPNAEKDREIARRAVALVMAHPSNKRWWHNTPRLRIAAAAAVIAMVTGALVSSRIRHGDKTHVTTTPLIWNAAIEPGAASAPATRMYDHSLRDYRAALLGDTR